MRPGRRPAPTATQEKGAHGNRDGSASRGALLEASPQTPADAAPSSIRNTGPSCTRVAQDPRPASRLHVPVLSLVPSGRSVVGSRRLGAALGGTGGRRAGEVTGSRYGRTANSDQRSSCADLRTRGLESPPRSPWALAACPQKPTERRIRSPVRRLMIAISFCVPGSSPVALNLSPT